MREYSDNNELSNCSPPQIEYDKIHTLYIFLFRINKNNFILLQHKKF